MAGVLFCLAYILGLAVSAIGNFPSPTANFLELLPYVGSLAVLAVTAALLLPRFIPLTAKTWLLAGFFASFATVYFWYKQPVPEPIDISKFITIGSALSAEPVTVQGKVLSMPMLTRSQRLRFWLEAEQIIAQPPQNVTGKLYVTVPLLQGTGIYPGHRVKVNGTLYQPKGSMNPGGFNFRAFLAREGCFAGMSGKFLSLVNAQFSDRPPWGWWQIRQRIAQSQILWLGSPVGELVSSMVLGGRAVDLPYDIKDLFVQTGLAHVLAASGFQVSLILGTLLHLTRTASPLMQAGVGTLGLVIFASLAGWQPAVARAVVMGFGVLIGTAIDRKIKPLNALLVAATLLLILEPAWIWDLGFQLSFLATFGLVTTVEPINKLLDWLPGAITAAIAVPLAATIWTLPILLYNFSIFAVYSIPVNIITTPLVSLISLGGVLSALAAVVYPLAGSALAYPLLWPTWGLIKITEWFSYLPGNAIALGKISLAQMISSYVILLMVWLWPKARPQWTYAGLATLVILLVPNLYYQANLTQATILASQREQVMVIQNQGRVVLINTGKPNTLKLTLTPFLQQQGINYIDAAIDLSSADNHWSELKIPIKTIYTTQISPGKQVITANQPTSLGNITWQFLSSSAPVLQLKLLDRTWLIMGRIEDFKSLPSLTNFDYLVWSGASLPKPLWQSIRPSTAIATTPQIAASNLPILQELSIPSYWTGQHGAVQWQPHTGLISILEQTDSRL